jgi:hypothetical protein
MQKEVKSSAVVPMMLIGIVIEILLFLAMACEADTNSTSTTVTLSWYEPSNLITPDASFILLQTTNLSVPLTNWTMMTLAATNCVTTNFDGTLQFCTNTIPIVPGAYFFTMTFSNFWGVSTTSNIAMTPPLPQVETNLTIRKN